MSDRVRDKSGNAIVEGDNVLTKIRGGKREGEVGSLSLLYNASHADVNF
jgi:hypothetical protein